VLRGPRRVNSDVGSQNLHDRPVVSRRVACDALERVDAAELDARILVAELVDGSAEAFGDLPLAIQSKRAGRVDSADAENDAREKLHPGCPDRILEAFALPRVRDLISGHDPSRDRHEEEKERGGENGDSGRPADDWTPKLAREAGSSALEPEPGERAAHAESLGQLGASIFPGCAS
jgi:hypothetical protein